MRRCTGWFVVISMFVGCGIGCSSNPAAETSDQDTGTPADTAASDTATPDTASPDTALPDTAITDTATADTATADTATADTATADADASDSAVTDAASDVTTETSADAADDSATDASTDVGSDTGDASDGCVTVVVDAKTHVVKDDGLVDAKVTSLAAGTRTCKVTSHSSYFGGGAGYPAALFVSGPNAVMVPTDGSSVSCSVSSTGDFRLMFTDGVRGDNGGLSRVLVDTTAVDVHGQLNAVAYPSQFAAAVKATLTSGKYKCRVTTSDASSSPGTAYGGVVFVSTHTAAVLPVTGATVPCDVATDLALFFTDRDASDNSGSATVSICPAP